MAEFTSTSFMDIDYSKKTRSFSAASSPSPLIRLISAYLCYDDEDEKFNTFQAEPECTVY